MIERFLTGSCALILTALAFTACGNTGEATGPPQTIEVHASWVIDVEEPTEVAEFADDIFIGTVEAAGDVTTPEGPTPVSLFRVRVDEVIKGNATGSVQVTQEGGLDRKRNAVVKFEGDTLLHVGKQYFFATKGPSRTIIPIAGDQWLDSGTKKQRLHAEYGGATRGR